MSTRADQEAEETLARLLADAGATGRELEFWWRDDDAVAATPALDRLLELRRKHGVPLALAVIPAEATEALATRLAGERDVWVLQHGWAHAQHSPPGEKKAELGGHRPLPTMLAELITGRERLRDLFGESFLPVLVPPWNRIGESARAARGDAGLPGFSAYGPRDLSDGHNVNTHVDIFAWKPARRPLTRAEAYGLLGREIERRLNHQEPIGILSHHLVHSEASWRLLDQLLGLLGHHPAMRWPKPPALFGLGAATAEPALTHPACGRAPTG